VNISAHAINQGTRGNIPSYDINQACCATSVLAKNTQPFYGGQDERTYTAVTQKDIHSVSTVLKTTLVQSITGALQGQLKSPEQLFILPCTPSITSDHQPGQEATQVKVTVSQTCSAVAYSSQELGAKATAFLAAQALHKLGAGYSHFGTVQVHVTQASVSQTNTTLVFLSFKALGAWMYGLSSAAQEQIKHLIAGKTTQEALQLLTSEPGIEQASIRFHGFGDATRLPKLSKNIHLTIIVV
jgi:VCBS repeat-containing protein